MVLSRSTQDKIALLRKYFIHPKQIYAEQKILREGQLSYFPVMVNEDDYRPLLDTELLAHLQGTKTLGIYLLDWNNDVKFLCIDVDINKTRGELVGTDEDVQRHTLELARIYKAYDIPFIVEYSGQRGYHLWTFFEEPVPASMVKSLGLFITSKSTGTNTTHVEVYPRQIQRHNGLGNLIKLPLGIHKKTGNRCFFVNGAFKPYEDQWDKLESAVLWSKTQVQEFLDKNYIPTIEMEYVAADASMVGPLALPCFVNIRNGVEEGVRDTAAFKYACYWRDRGADQEETIALMLVWNERNSPPLTEQALLKDIQSAFKRAYSPFPCQNVLMDPYCSNTCVFYERKMRERTKQNTL